MEFIKPIYRDVKAKELNELLTEFMGKLENISIGYNEELMDITLIESERREKDFDELIKNPDEFHKVIDLIDKQSLVEELLSELKDIVYIDYETTEINVDTPLSSLKTTPRLRKQSDYANFLADHVKPHIFNKEYRRNEIAKMEGVVPQTITNRVKQVFGEETTWKEYVRQVRDGKW